MVHRCAATGSEGPVATRRCGAGPASVAKSGPTLFSARWATASTTAAGPSGPDRRRPRWHGRRRGPQSEPDPSSALLEGRPGEQELLGTHPAGEVHVGDGLVAGALDGGDDAVA